MPDGAGATPFRATQPTSLTTSLPKTIFDEKFPDSAAG
jgi:hypothetical protein